MNRFNKIFTQQKNIIGVVHVEALPSSPNYGGDVRSIISHALKEAKMYTDAGIDALMIENMHDVPYVKDNKEPAISSLMSIIGYEFKQKFEVPCGIQVLASGNKPAMAAAHSAGLDFIRAEGFVFGHLADEGYIDSCAGDLLRYRNQIGAENVAVFTDVKKKHSAHAMTSDVGIEETAKTAEFFLSDGIIVTGSSTGVAADLEELKSVKQACEIPVLVGSGVTIDNVEKYLEVVDAMIVGSWFKTDGHWASPLDAGRVSSFMQKVNELRS